MFLNDDRVNLDIKIEIKKLSDSKPHPSNPIRKVGRGFQSGVKVPGYIQGQTN